MTMLESTMRRATMVTLDDGTRAVETRVRLQTAGENVGALLEDFLDVVQAAEEVDAVNASLMVRYREPTPSGQDLVLRGWIERIEGRRMAARITCSAGARLTADARAVFVAADPALAPGQFATTRTGR